MAALLALVSSVLWGTADFFGGQLSKRLAALVVVAVSQAAAFVLLVPWAALSGEWHVAPAYLPWAIVWGVTGPLGLAAFYYALSIGTMGVVSPISATGIIVPVAVGLVQGEQLELGQAAAIAVAIVGVVLVGGPDVRTDMDGSRGHGWRPIAFAVVAALGFGSSYVFVSQGAKSSLVMTLLTQRLTSAAVASILVFLTVGWVWPSRHELVRVAGVGVGDVSANAFYGWSSTLGLLSVTAVFGSLFPVVTSFLAWALLHERMTRLQRLGVALAMMGVLGLAAAGA
jgi:drug/metabolite transporter (DMT)-like permease